MSILYVDSRKKDEFFENSVVFSLVPNAIQTIRVRYHPKRPRKIVCFIAIVFNTLFVS